MAGDSRKKTTRVDDDYEDDDLEDDADQDDEDDEDDEERAPRRPRNWFQIGAVLVALIVMFAVGGAVGAYVIRQHDHKHSVMVTVGTTEITRDDFEHRLDVADGGPVINQMVLDELRLQFFRQQRSLVPDSEVEEKYKVFSENAEQFNRELFKTRQTQEDVRRTIRLSLSEQALLKRGITVTDADVQAFYQMNISPSNQNAQYYHPETVVVAVITTKSRSDIGLASEALKSRASFGAVARQYSTDASKARDGLLSPIKKNFPGLKSSPALANAMFSLKPGEDFGPKLINGAWWIIRCVEHTPERTDSFDSVKENCRLATELWKGAKANQGAMEADFRRFCQSAAIVSIWPQYKDIITIKKQTQ